MVLRVLYTCHPLHSVLLAVPPPPLPTYTHKHTHLKAHSVRMGWASDWGSLAGEVFFLSPFSVSLSLTLFVLPPISSPVQVCVLVPVEIVYSADSDNIIGWGFAVRLVRYLLSYLAPLFLYTDWARPSEREGV